MRLYRDKDGRDRTRAVLFLLIISALAGAFVLVAKSAHASGPTVNGACGTWNGGSTPITMNVGCSGVYSTGDVVVVEAVAQVSNSTAGKGIASLDISVSSVIDTTLASDVTLTSVGGIKTCLTTGTVGCTEMDLAYFYTGNFVGTSGTDTITATFSQAHGVNAQINILVEDTTGVTNTVIASGSGACATSGKCSSPANFGVLTNTANTIAFGGLISDQSTCGGGNTDAVAAAGYTRACTISAAGTGVAEYSVGLASPSPTTVSMTQVSNTMTWVAASLLLGNAAGGTNNVQCTPICTPTNGGTYVSNSSSIFSGSGLTKSMFWFFQQAPATVLTIQNVTVKVSQVSTSIANPRIGYALYEPASPLVAASAGNQWTLQKQAYWPVTNGSTAFFLHANPGWSVCASCYYMVAILANSTHSNSATIKGSGIKFYETSAAVTEYYYNPPSTTFPTTFYSNTLQTPRLFLYFEGVFAVLTTTSTSTTTLTGTQYTTQTVTQTFSSLNAALSIQTTTGYTMALLVILVPALALGGVIAFTTKSFPGFAVGFITGAAIGTGLGAQYQLVTPAFEALAAIAMIFMGVMAFLTSRGQGMG